MEGTAAAVGRGLVKRYPQGDTTLQVLDGVDVTVGRGEFVSVMGPSGSGKSTLLHLLGGLDVPDEGAVELDGEALSGLDDDARTRLRAERVGIVYQFFNLVPVLTAAENVALPAVIAGDRAGDHRGRTTQLLDLVGLADHADKLPSQLSGGQQQRIAIARALFFEPTLVLADEPTGNLDLETGADILGLLVDARCALGQSLLMVTHDPRSAACGDRVLFLRDGVVAHELDLRPIADADARTRAVLALLSGASEPAVEVADGRNGVRRRRAPLRATPIEG